MASSVHTTKFHSRAVDGTYDEDSSSTGKSPNTEDEDCGKSANETKSIGNPVQFKGKVDLGKSTEIESEANRADGTKSYESLSWPNQNALQTYRDWSTTVKEESDFECGQGASHSSSGEIMCDKCGKQFNGLQTLRRHKCLIGIPPKLSI